MGMVVTDFLSEHFTNIMDYNFTAEAEEALDDIAEGSVEWQKMIGDSIILSMKLSNLPSKIRNGIAGKEF